MAYSLYDATAVMAKYAITALDGMITKAQEHPNSATFFEARLIDDMKPLTFQVHYATAQAESIAARLSGKEPVELEEDVDTYEKMHARTQKAIQALDALDKDAVNKIGETMMTYETGGRELVVPIKATVAQLNLPNIYFHVSMAYAIFRKEGVPLGKRDWSRPFVSEYL